MHLSRIIIAIAMLLMCGGLLWIGLVGIMAWSILHPPRMTAGKAIYHLGRLSPGDLGLNFEEQSFTVRDEQTGKKLNIASWWIPAGVASGRCALLIHGYADAKVGSIGWAPLLHQLNCNILAIDLRAHGDSDGSCCTGGFFERHDVNQVIDQLVQIYPMQTNQLILFGISLGAAVACATAAGRSDIKAAVLESPFTDYRKAITTHTRLMGLPDGLTIKAAVFAAEKFTRSDFSQVRPADLLPTVKCPSLVIAGQQDELLDNDDFQIFKNTATDFWLVPDAGHGRAMQIDPAVYELRIRNFLADKW